MTDILAGNTNRGRQPVLGQVRRSTGPDGRRPATLKTGTNNDAKDLNAYGYIAPPTEEGRADGAYALAVGVWNGNSDNSLVSTPEAPALLDRRLDLRLAGLPPGGQRRVAGDRLHAPAGRPRPGRDRPVDRASLAASGGPAVDEWFIADTQPQRVGSRTGPAASDDPDQLERLRGPVRRLDGGRPRLAAPGRARARASPAARTGRGPPTSTTAASSRTARRGARSSAARAAARRARRRAASRSRPRMRAA